MKTKILKGQFGTCDNKLVSVEIWREQLAPCLTPGRLQFAGDGALTIRWENVAAHEPIQQSHATLRIISPGDRTYTDLYTDQATSTRMDVYVDGSLYWSGMLDPEQYEEPYERVSDYEVMLRFSDFGPLGRIRLNECGIKSIRYIVDQCLNAAGINAAQDWNKLETKTEDSQSIADNIGVNTARWIDSDGEAAYMLDVLEDIFTPLGLRMVQRAGKVWIYDLHYLCREMQEGYRSRPVEWSSDSQTLSAGRVYKDLKVTWESYCQDGNMMTEDLWEDPQPDGRIVSFRNQGATRTEDGARMWSIPVDPTETRDITNKYEAASFSLWTKQTGRDILTALNGARIMYLVSQADGQDTQGIAVRWTTRDFPGGSEQIHGVDRETFCMWPDNTVANLSKNNGVIALTQPFVWPGLGTHTNAEEPNVNGSHRDRYYARALGDNWLKLTIPLLISTKYNPFNQDEDPFDLNVPETYNYIYMPFALCYSPDSDPGSVYVWDNRSSLDDSRGTWSAQAKQTVASTSGRWIFRTDYTAITSWLAYYDASIVDGKENRTDKNILDSGFTNNRQAICPRSISASKTLLARAGQYINPPDRGPGVMWIEIYSGSWRRCARLTDFTPDIDSHEAYEHRIDLRFFKWLLIGAPKLELVSRTSSELRDTDDEEFTFTMNADAEEDLSITTALGTGVEAKPLARGAFLDMRTFDQVYMIHRYQTARPVQLLASTLGAQYSERKAVIKGEAFADLGGVTAYSEASSPGKVFTMTGMEQDLYTMTGEMTITETQRGIIQDYGN